MISKKELVSDVFNQLQLALQRRNHAHPAQVYPQNSLDLFTHYHSISWCLGVQRSSDNDM
jgi:hypothetical protein